MLLVGIVSFKRYQKEIPLFAYINKTVVLGFVFEIDKKGGRMKKNSQIEKKLSFIDQEQALNQIKNIKKRKEWKKKL